MKTDVESVATGSRTSNLIRLLGAEMWTGKIAGDWNHQAGHDLQPAAEMRAGVIAGGSKRAVDKATVRDLPGMMTGRIAGGATAPAAFQKPPCSVAE